MTKTLSETRQQKIHDRLNQAFSPTVLQVIDESDQHIGHAGYEDGARHFALVIEAQCFESVSKVTAHRMIYDVLNDMIPDQIHALKIKIK